MTWASALYVGQLSHRRFQPRFHAFRYSLFLMYLDLDELPQVFNKRWLWSFERRNLCSFRRQDYFGDPKRPLKECVLDRVEQETGRRPQGPVRLLTHLRTWGHCFNPVSFYYCFADDGKTLEAILAEITNTPWMERHQYVLPISEGSQEFHDFSFAKSFHVSPFFPMKMGYEWQFSNPGSDLSVMMANRAEFEASPVFDVALKLRRQEINGRSLAWALVRYPAMSLFVVFWIHWNALRLWLKRTPFFTHPDKLKRNH